jgi:excisionase family DNA binding protein
MTHIGEWPITATVEEFCRLSGIGRSTTYKLLDSNDLDSVKIGGRRLIIIESYLRLIEQRQGAAQASAENSENDEDAGRGDDDTSNRTAFASQVTPATGDVATPSQLRRQSTQRKAPE